MGWASARVSTAVPSSVRDIETATELYLRGYPINSDRGIVVGEMDLEKVPYRSLRSLWSVLTSVEVRGNKTDRLALLELKARIVDPCRVLSSWNDSSDICKWYGVTCGYRHRRVTVLNLSSENLAGVVAPHIGNLSFLREVYLQNNSFCSEIPPQFGRLFRLQKLFLNNNSFSGQIPSNLSHCSNLLNLDLRVNKLEGNLPAELSFLSKLQQLKLGFNGLTGNIPPSSANLSSLQVFITNSNNLSGSGQSTDLDFLCSLTNSTKLKVLCARRNALGGRMPNCISNLSITLSWFLLSGNHISGVLPSGIGNLINLEILGMMANNISGNIPSEIGNLNKMKIMYLGQNDFSGQIPGSIGNLRMLIHLGLNINNLRGLIPLSLGNCQNLLLLDLSTNDLSGNIPPQIMYLSSLSLYLDLSQNNLTGSLPIEVGNLKNLGELRLNGNRLSQQIPSSISSCVVMERLYIQDNFFEGPLPSTISSMRGLQILNVSNNRLFGQIPEYLELLNLTNLSLSYNDFNGALPTGGVFGSAISTSIVGNKKLCGGLPDFQLPKCNYKEAKQIRTSRTTKILISTISVLVGVACMLSLLYFFRYRHNKKSLASSSSIEGLLHVSYHSLLKATGGFSSTNLLGMGSFGSVYKGLLDQTQSNVAIKILDLTHHGASKSFIVECETLRRIRHRNLVKVLTACSGFDFNGNDFKALVYEFMSNGSLDEWLQPIAMQYTTRRKLSLLERVNIAIDVACALDYLHHHCETPIVHCDLKPSNVLLDDEMTGHVGDFGLARFLPETVHKLLAHQSSSIGVKGSFGYIAPEYGLGSVVSIEGDVYSFGVLILEMFTGKRPTDDMFDNGLNLNCFAKAALANRVENVIDPVLLQEIQELEKRRMVARDGKNKSWFSTLKCLALIIEIGVCCSSKSPRERMDISDALIKLQGVRKNFIAIA
ncbi:probable LRR receptor-like serine/threonine-protein kinase At3g47570 [Eucalyptus grandis]|uniref:probable LRR receptor-like serine/threonine-protein kinase At3g47570 n=1 Tax=Eucalyptus grandis TaxID=71139 RepID=UPI00192F0B87|nr:probable LRR receptor-like serine/threonine-protein kinase At3g47570 [Eucalyptus grandis]